MRETREALDWKNIYLKRWSDVCVKCNYKFTKLLSSTFKDFSDIISDCSDYPSIVGPNGRGLKYRNWPEPNTIAHWEEQKLDQVTDFYKYFSLLEDCIYIIANFIYLLACDKCRCLSGKTSNYAECRKHMCNKFDLISHEIFLIKFQFDPCNMNAPSTNKVDCHDKNVCNNMVMDVVQMVEIFQYNLQIYLLLLIRISKLAKW